MIRRLTNNFAVLALLGVALSWLAPSAFTWATDGSVTVFGAPFISVALGGIMLAMGLTLTPGDYRRLAQVPRALAIGVAAQFLIMPLAGYAIARLLDLEPGLAVGLILVACCPGGTASNIVAYLARAHVALSVAMTMASTLLAILLTPLLTGALAGAYVEIDRWNLFLNMVSIVLIPVIAGTALNQLFPRAARAVMGVLPLVAVMIVVLLVGGIVGGAKAAIVAHAGDLLLGLFLLHAAGFALGYGAARLLGLDVAACRTISIEVGMQNSGLGSGLAKSPAFAAQFAAAASQAALAPVPAAISSVYHVVIGSLLASYWRRSADARRLAAAPSVALSE